MEEQLERWEPVTKHNMSELQLFLKDESVTVLKTLIKWLNDTYQQNYLLKSDGKWMKDYRIIQMSLVDNTIKETNLKLVAEQLGGFFFLKADSLEEEKEIVSKHPGLKVGAFEIRIVDEDITEIVGA